MNSFSKTHKQNGQTRRWWSEGRLIVRLVRDWYETPCPVGCQMAHAVIANYNTKSRNFNRHLVEKLVLGRGPQSIRPWQSTHHCSKLLRMSQSETMVQMVNSKQLCSPQLVIWTNQILMQRHSIMNRSHLRKPIYSNQISKVRKSRKCKKRWISL